MKIGLGDPCSVTHPIETFLSVFDQRGGTEQLHLPHLPGFPRLEAKP